MCGGRVITAWSVPCELTKCCSCFSRTRRPLPSASDFEFKPYANNRDDIDRLLTSYERLTNGTHFKPRSRSYCSWIGYGLKHIMYIVYLILLCPIVLFIFILSSIWYIIYQLIQIPLGILMLHCGMTFTKKARIANLKDGDSYHDYVKITHSPSKEEEKRFGWFHK